MVVINDANDALFTPVLLHIKPRMRHCVGGGMFEHVLHQLTMISTSCIMFDYVKQTVHFNKLKHNKCFTICNIAISQFTTFG